MDADRVIADLRELAELTGGPDGARRVCWTDEWVKARELVRSKLEELPVEITTDAAGNVWADLPGEQEGFVIVGSHVDSVPAGGWLDGALGLFAALETLRAHADEKPPVGLRFVDWADEEGARFGRSLFGSSACAGTLEIDEVRDLKDREGERLEDVVGEYDVDLVEGPRVGLAAAGRAGVPRAAHRAGPGPREPRRVRGGRARHGRRRAPRRGVQRAGLARRRDADGHAAGLVPGRGARRARRSARSGSPTRAATAPPAARAASRAW